MKELRKPGGEQLGLGVVARTAAALQGEEPAAEVAGGRSEPGPGARLHEGPAGAVAPQDAVPAVQQSAVPVVQQAALKAGPGAHAAGAAPIRKL